MPQKNNLTLGSPRFADPALATLARTHGNSAAWSAALAQGAATAARGVTGDFAVALRDGDRVFLAVDRFAVRSMERASKW